MMRNIELGKWGGTNLKFEKTRNNPTWRRCKDFVSSWGTSLDNPTSLLQINFASFMFHTCPIHLHSKL